MERLIQYLDNIEDTFYAVALLAERIRRVAKVLILFVLSSLMTGLGVMMALLQPPIGLALAALLIVTVLYRSATTGVGPTPPFLHS